MAKTMVQIENGVVVNLLWCSDAVPETESLVNAGDFPVAIGDTYCDGRFYRNKEILLTEAEMQQALQVLGVAV